MDKKELLELIEEKTDDVFLEYQKKMTLKAGTYPRSRLSGLMNCRTNLQIW